MTIRNTTREAAEKPAAAFAEHVLGGPGAIERSEARGQAEFVASDVLPSSALRDRPEFERIGVRFGEVVEGDELFVHAQLPEGWKRKGTDHSMWSDIVDQYGRTRINVFYKAAFYDRKAHANIVPRLSVKYIEKGDSFRDAEDDVVDNATGATVHHGGKDGRESCRAYIEASGIDQHGEWPNP